MKSFSSFLAFRYLQPKRSFVSVITLISVLGVALGVMILVVVIAVFTGYGERIKSTILGFEPHIVVDSAGILDNWMELGEKIEKVPEVVSWTPYVRGQVVFEYDSGIETRRLAPIVRAILPPEGEELKRMESKIRMRPSREPGGEDVPDGNFAIDLDTAVIGDELADGMGISVGDTVLLYSPRNVDEILDAIEKAEKAETEDERRNMLDEVKEMSVPQEMTISGIFDSGHYDFDGNFVFIHLETGQTLYHLGPDAHGIAVQTTDGFKASEVRDKIYELTDSQFRMLTWVDMHRTLFEAVAAERQAMYFVLFFLTIVAGFCIMNTMITVVYQKRSEIGVLKAVGATERQISNVFLFQGFVIGAIGVLVGLILAMIVVTFREPITTFLGWLFGIDIFSDAQYKIAGGLPAKVEIADVTIISTCGLIACLVASTAPAWIASRLEPAKALRSE